MNQPYSYRFTYNLEPLLDSRSSPVTKTLVLIKWHAAFSAAVMKRVSSCRFIYSLERLTAFYKPLLDNMRGPVMNALGQVTGMLQSLLLESLQRRAAKLPGLMSELKLVLPSLLMSHNHALQNNALQLIRVLLPEEPDNVAGLPMLTLVQTYHLHEGSRRVNEGLTTLSPDLTATSQDVLCFVLISISCALETEAVTAQALRYCPHAGTVSCMTESAVS